MKFTMRDEKNEIVAGLEDVGEDNALVRRIPWGRPLSSLELGDTTRGFVDENFYLTRTE